MAYSVTDGAALTFAGAAAVSATAVFAPAGAAVVGSVAAAVVQPLAKDAQVSRVASGDWASCPAPAWCRGESSQRCTTVSSWSVWGARAEKTGVACCVLRCGLLFGHICASRTRSVQSER